MDKKVIALIVGAVVLIAAGVLFFVYQNNRTNENSNNNTGNEGGVVTSTPDVTPTPTEDTEEPDNNQEPEGEPDMNQNRVLVLYFSRSGNTRTVANFIHESAGGDIVELETVKEYPSSYNELLTFAQNEQRNNERPELKTTLDLSNYDTIFIGYPNWWGDMPMAIYSLLDQYDFSGKTIAPFITHGGSGFSGTPAKIRNLEPNATVVDGLAVSGSNASNSKSTVDTWVSGLGL